MMHGEKMQNNFNSQMLHLIKERKSSEILLKILENTSNPGHFIDSIGRTLLHYACESSNHRIALHLLKVGSKIDAQDYQGKTALMLTTNHTLIECLLEDGANIHIRDNTGKSTLQAIMETGRFPRTLVRRLIQECGGDLDKIAKSLIDAKCSIRLVIPLGYADLTRCLLKYGCPFVISTASHPQETLLRAVQLNDLENVRALLDYGLDVNAEDNLGFTALYIYGYERSSENLEMLHLLLDRGANLTQMMTQVTLTGLQGEMQIANVLRYCKRELVREILERNVNLCAKDARGCTALHYLARNKHSNVVEELRGRLIDVNARDDRGKTPLHCVELGSASMVRFLVEKGADINAKDADGMTPLARVWEHTRYYESERRIQVIESLLRYGADVRVLDFQQNFLWTTSVLAHLAIAEDSGSLIEGCIQNIKNDERSKGYFEMCKRQLDQMRQVKVWKNISICEFLTASERKIERHVRNKKLLLNLRKIKCKNGYLPYYRYVVRDRIVKALKNANLRKRAAVDVFEAIGLCPNAYSIISDKIVSCLTERDLKKMYQKQ